MLQKKISSELRQDLVSGEWVVTAPQRGRRPHFYRYPGAKLKPPPKSTCPFEDPQKAGHEAPLLMLNQRGSRLQYAPGKKLDWFLQVVPNKFPALSEGVCPVKHHTGPYSWLEGAGFHEVVIYRNHIKHPGHFSRQEAEQMFHAYQLRYQALSRKECIAYILVFHNHGKESGATIFHPHSQILALPVIPPDVSRSIHGSKEYFRKHRRCVHCEMVAWERKTRQRVIYENKEMIAFSPFATRVSFEVRIFPKKHENAFERIDKKERVCLADAFHNVFRRVIKSLHEPDYNFFIHTAPVHPTQFKHYHWHIEILPRTSVWAGLELGTGIDLSSITPEEAAALLRNA